MPDPHSEHGPAGRRIVAGLALVALAASLVVGGNLAGLRDKVVGSAVPPARPAVFSRVAEASDVPGHARKTVLRSQPWWQTLRVLSGSSAATAELPVDRDAIQWRVRWRCQAARRLVIGASTQSRPIVDAACPGSGIGSGARPGAARLSVAADGPWRLRVEQQLDVPLEEPPLAAMSEPDASRIARGDVYGIDRKGQGRLTLFRLPDRRYALRLDRFYVSPNIDLEIRLSRLRAPRSTREFRRAPSVRIAPLDVTTGSMNVVLASGIDPTRFRSAVIWCPPVASAYAAATLRPVR